MSNSQLIDWLLPAAETLATLLSDVEGVDPTPVTSAMLRNGKLSTEHYAEFRMSFIRAKELVASQVDAERILAEEILDTQTALATGGFELHTDQRQTLLDQMAPVLGWSAGLLAAMKRIGRPVSKRWHVEGWPAEPTTEEIEHRRARTLAENQTADRINAASEARRAAIDDPAKTGAEIVAATVEAFG